MDKNCYSKVLVDIKNTIADILKVKLINQPKEAEIKAKQLEKNKFFCSQYEVYSAFLYNWVIHTGVHIGVIPVQNPRDLLVYDVYHGVIPRKFLFVLSVKESFDIEQAKRTLYNTFYMQHPRARRVKTKISLHRNKNVLYIEFTHLLKIMGDIMRFNSADGKLITFSPDNGDLKLVVKANEKFKILYNGRLVETSFDIECDGHNYFFVWGHIILPFIPKTHHVLHVLDNVLIF